MELCLGSLQDFYDGRLADCVSDSCFEIVNITWDIVRGLEFLHKNTIPHGSLGLRKILLIKKTDTNKLVAKVSGYTTHYNPVRCPIIPFTLLNYLINSFYLEKNRSFEDDLVALGNVFFFMATRNADKKPKFPITADELTRFDEYDEEDKANLLAKMINQLILHNKPKPSISALLRHPFFTINDERARQLLLINNSDIKAAVCVEKLEEWKNSVDENSDNNFSLACVDDLNEIIVSK